MLSAFHAETGIPLVVNTSFNTAGVPLVNQPTESVAIFLDTDLDLLAIGPYLVSR